MLFPRRLHEGMADGSITLAFRRWKRARAKVGSRHRTPVGLIEIDAVDIVEPGDVSASEARSAGYDERGDLLAFLGSREGRIYRVTFHFAGDDPRVALRNRSELDEDEVAEIKARLARFDRASRSGPWTIRVLRAIRDYPAVRAADLAPDLGRETQPFSRDARRPHLRWS